MTDSMKCHRAGLQWKKLLATFILVLLGIFEAAPASALNCISVRSDNWNKKQTWNNCNGGTPGAGDTVTIQAGYTVTLNVNTPSLAALTINAGGTLANTGANTITLAGPFSNAGTYTGGSGAISLSGNFTNTGTFSAGASSTWVFTSTTAQTITGAVTFASLALNNGSGLTIANNVTATNLNLINGALTTGSNLLTTTGNCTTAISRTSGFVDGKIRLTFPNASNTTCTYPVGSNGYYAPITLVATSTGGTLTGWTTTGNHPSIAGAGIDTTKHVSRYWSLRTSGDAISVSTYSATFNFPGSDVDNGAAVMGFVVAKYASATWSKPAEVTASASATTISNVTGGLGVTNDYVIGEDANACPVTPGFATCVCDNFGRASLNPSTIFGGDYVVSHSGSNPFEPNVVSNYLRLTDSSTNVAAAATVPGTFPAAGNNITVEFRHYAYGGTNPGADGIALTLSDSAVTAVPGAFGGSLGYAQKTGINGFAGGWLGVGIDEFGNYANPTEGRVGGPGFLAEAVTLRGSGSGAGNASTNYPYLATSGALSTPIDAAGSATRGRGHLYRITVDATQYTWNGSTGNKTTLVKVERDVTGTGSSYTTLPNLNLTNIYNYNTGQSNVPQNWKLSFTGATGSNTNIHEIKGLKVCSTYFTPPGSFDIQFNTTGGLTCSTPTSSPTPPMVTVRARNSQGVLDSGYAGTVFLIAKKPDGTIPATAKWRKVGTATDIPNGGMYTFVAADSGAAQFYLVDTAADTLTVTIHDSNSSTTSPTSITFSASSASYVIQDAEPGVQAVAGRPHLMKVTYYSGCSASGTGSKSMSGWYVPDAADPSGNAPRMCPPPTGTSTPTSCLSNAPACSKPQLDTSPPATSNLTLNFNGSSSAYFCLTTTDVGKYYPQLRETAAPATTTTSAPLMTFVPFAVVVSGIQSGTTANPAGSANDGGLFTTAGTNFQTTVGGYLWSNSSDTGDGGGVANDGVPDVKTLAALTAGGVAAHYADSVALGVASSEPTGGSVPTLSGSPVVVTAGQQTQLSMAYSEVGSFALSASPSSSYLGTKGADLTTRTFIFSTANGTQNNVVGRFKPHHFRVTNQMLTHGCLAGTFTYEGQPFGLGFTVSARNAFDKVTTKYGVNNGPSDKYAPVATAPLSLGAENANDGIDRGSRISSSPPTSTGLFQNPIPWTAGQFTLGPSNYVFSRSAVPEGAFQTFTVGLGVNDDSRDGVPLLGADMNATTTGSCSATGNCNLVTLGSTDMRYGRLRIDNAYGSEQLPLSVRVQAQYWNGSSYIPNKDDNCTALVAGDFQNPLPAQQGVPVTTSVQSGDALNNGGGTIRLAKPNPAPTGGKGSVRLQTLSGSPLDGYLPGQGVETFGIYKSGPVIYLREVFR